MTENIQSADLLALAVDTARAAGELLSSFTGRVSVARTKSSPTDVVTEMDRKAEELIRSRILSQRPADAILGEEEGQTGAPGETGVRWVVDPLDGTVNYLYGLRDWAVSIGAEVDGEIVAGAVFAPRAGELFTAIRGGGAWLSGPDGGEAEKLSVGPGVALDRALVATGFGYRAERRQVQGEVVSALLPRIRDIRRGGSASVDLCALALGRVDAYYERGLNYWDYAAGALVASEAGVKVGGLKDPAPGTSMTIAAAEPLFGELSAALAALNPERDA